MNFRCAYFWDTAHGVVAGDGHILYYRSGVWKESAYPEAPAIVRSLRLLDGTDLYAASGTTCVWKSSDSGATWKLTSALLPNADDIYLGTAGNILGMNLTGSGMTKGTTFATTNGVDCVAARDDGPTLAYSNDGGYTWTNSRSEINSGYCCVADPCTGKFYAMTDGMKFQLWQSTDAGRDWLMLRDFVTDGTDNLAGGNWGVLYVQGVRDIYRFTPWNGWQTLNWPDAGAEDRRMFAFGPVDNYLVSLNGGDVWLWDAGPDATPWRKPLNIKDTVVVGCSPPSVDTVGIDWPNGIDTLFVSPEKNSGAIIRPDTLKLTPYSREPVFTIRMSPRSHLGIFPIHAWAYYECDTIRWDTSFSILLSPKPQLELADSVHLLGCADTLIPIWITAPSCDTFRTVSVSCSDTSGTFDLADTSELGVIAAGSRKALWIGVHGNRAGTSSAWFHIVLQSNDTGVLFDTAMRLSVATANRRRALHISIPSPLWLSNCKGSRVPVIIQAHPCADLIVEECAVTIDTSAHFTEAFTLPARVAAGANDTFFILFPSQGLEKAYSISVRIRGTYADTPYVFDTTLHAIVTFNSSAGAVASNAISVVLNSITVCAEADTVVMLTNVGCNAVTMTGDVSPWQPGWTASDPAFPFTLGPDSSFDVPVHYTPTGRAPVQQLLSYSFTDIDGNFGKSLPVALSLTVLPAQTALVLSDIALNLGTFSRCNAAGDTSVTLTNTGCDSLAITGATLDTGTGFALLSGGDTVLAPGQSEKFRIGFADSIAGGYGGSLHLTTIGAHGGAEVDTSIQLNATVIEGSKLAALNVQSIDFGTTSICEERDSSIRIRNMGCEPDTITGLSFANPSFTSSLALPLVLAPGRDSTIPISTQTDTSGHATTNSDTLRFTADLDAALPPVLLSRGLTYPGSFALGLAGADSAQVAHIVQVYILRNGTVPTQASELDFALTYDDDLLSYVKAIPPDIAMMGSQTLPNGLTTRSFAMKPATDRDTIATLAFESYLAKDQRTPITLSQQKFMSGGETSPPCVASLDTNTSGANFTLELACGDGEISKALEGVPLQIVTLHVNSNALSFTLERGDARYAICSAQVLNVLGTEELERTLSLQPVTQVSVGVGTLPAGVYYLRLSSGGYVVARRFVILR